MGQIWGDEEMTDNKERMLTTVESTLNRFDARLNAADNHRRRMENNADKLGGAITDLECKINKLLEDYKNAKSCKH